MARRKRTEITANHLQRRAVVYLRQSSLPQVEENTGSADNQRDQGEHAVAAGWTQDKIDLYDEDLGVTGRSVEHRAGMQRLLKAVANGEIGAIFVSEISRLNRARSHFSGLVDLCRINDVLLVVDGRVIDLEDPHDRFLANIRADVAEYDIDIRRLTLMEAKWAKVKRGLAVSGPPTGYVKDPTGTEKKPTGKWIKDPNQEVQNAINRLYDDYERLGSVGAVLRYYKKEGILLPSRAGQQHSWGLSRGRIRHFLTNRAYMGDYIFGRTVDVGGSRRPPEKPEDIITTASHHEPYVEPERWQRLQAIMRKNSPRVRQPAGRGAALCQGLLRCDKDNRKLYPYYPSNKPYSYKCSANYIMFGDRTCCPHVSGPRLDAFVTSEVLAAVTPPDAAAVLAAVQDATAGYEAACRQRELELARAEQAVALWTRQLAATMPEFHEVHVECQRNLGQAIRYRTALQRQHRENPVVPPLVPTPEVIAEIQRLAADLPAVWHAPSTTHLDRKRLLRLFISEITLLSVDPSAIKIALHWAGGATTEHTIPQARATAVLVAELSKEGLSSAEIFQRIQGAKTTTNKPYTRRHVWFALERLRKNALKAAQQTQ